MSKYYERTTTTDLPPTVLPSGHAERQYLHTTQAGVKVPLAQTFATGLIVYVVAQIFMLLLDVLDGWKWALAFGALALLTSWFISYRHWFGLTRVEEWTGWDINGDGSIGEPETHVVRIEMQRIEENGHLNVTKRFDLPLSEDELVSLARGLMTGVPFSEREWTGSGKLLSLSRFRELRSEMIRRGLLDLANGKDARQGYALTADGEAIMRDYAGLSDYAG